MAVSRLFDGTDDVMSYAMEAADAEWNFGTLLIIAKIATTSDSTWLSFMEGENAAGAIAWALGRRNNGQLYLASGGALASSVTVEDADGWALYATTKATGSSTATSHKIIISSGTRTSTAQDTALADTGTTALGRIKLGGDDDFANVYLGAAAFWDGTVLTTGQLDGIVTAKTTQSILDLSPSWCVDDGPTSNQFTNDLVADIDRSAITGTTDSADDPSGWVYLGDSAAAGIPILTMRPRIPT